MTKSKINDAYFSTPDYNTIGDTYVDNNKLIAHGYSNNCNNKPKFITAFKSASKNLNSKIGDKSNIKYEFDDDYPLKNNHLTAMSRKRDYFRDDNSKFHKHGPFKSTYNKSNGIFSNYKYQESDYNNKDSIKKIERKLHHDKIIKGSFKCGVSGNNFFQPLTDIQDSKVSNSVNNYGKLYNIKNKSKEIKIWKPNNPAKKGYNKTINKFPYYKESKEIRFIQPVQMNYWIPNGKGTLPKPCITPNLLYRNRVN